MVRIHSIIGIPWFRPENYAEFHGLFRSEQLPHRFEDWLYRAENRVKESERDGFTVERAYINLDAFTEWCRSRGKSSTDYETCEQFARELAVRRHEAGEGIARI